MIEEGTMLYEKCQADSSAFSIDEELEREMYELLIDKLVAKGYEHYEISNFAKPGYRSRHNSSYWNGTPYIGIGAAAHSFDLETRSWNIADINRYIEGIQQGERKYESETLNEDTRYNDMVTVALRTCEGLNLSLLSEQYRKYCLKNAKRFIDDGLLAIDNQQLHLTRKGLFVSDMVMSELMMVD
jgi:oxygen-independent coproporphyrinogen-3 oxidase